MAAKMMQEQRFIDHVYNGYHAGERYCFILGAGASLSSGIQTGEQLMQQWHEFLLSRGESYIRESAEDVGFDAEEYEHLLAPDVKLNNKDYFTLFDLRFAGQASAAYDALEREMEGKQPGFGYYPLSMLLTKTENKLVITTNFDSLTEDAIFIYTHKHPLVVGHESLAGFIGNTVRRPVIAKVHRDLFFSPMNRNKDMQALADGWETPLRNALQRYIPIVIGYAGGDRTLMTLLNRLKLKSIYWCYLGQKPDEDICNVVEKNHGYLVKILGFDEIMFQLAERFAQEISFTDPREGIIKQAEQRCQNYQESFERIKKTYEKKSKDRRASDVAGMEQALGRFEIRKSLEGLVDSDFEEMIQGAKERVIKGQYTKAVDEFSYLIALHPTLAILYELRALAYYKMGQYQNDLQDMTKAIELDPENAEYYDRLGGTLYKLGHFEEALANKNKAVELKPQNVKFVHRRAVILHRMKKYEEALEDRTRAITLDPNNALYIWQRGVTLHKMKHYKEALSDKTKAIVLAPENAQYYNSRGVTFHEMKRYDEAVRDQNKAIKLKPDNAAYYHSRAVTLYAMNHYEEALKDESMAIDLVLDNANYYYGRSLIYHSMGDVKHAEQDFRMAKHLGGKKKFPELQQ